MEYLLVTRRDRTKFRDEEAEKLFAAEALGVEELRKKGFIRGIWSRADVTGACLLIAAQDEAAVRSGLATLPLFQQKMVQIEALIPLSPY
jgi:muconolactone delta-isomerase